MPDTPQKKMNHSNGMYVHPFLPWQKNYPHIWPTSSVASGGQQYKLRKDEDLENYEPFEGLKAQKNNSSSAGKPPAMEGYGGYGGNDINGYDKDTVRNGANAFHQDDGFFDQPPSAVVLNAKVLPKVGGDTIFADMEAAYNGLSDKLKNQIHGMTHTMDWQHAFPLWENEVRRRDKLENDDGSFKRHVDELKSKYPPSVHPVVRKHPVTGRLCINVNRGFTAKINDMPRKEGTDLFRRLVRTAERPEYQARIQWQNVGDVVIYDNRCTNHYAVSDYGLMGPRSLHHIALLGEPTYDINGNEVTW